MECGINQTPVPAALSGFVPIGRLDSFSLMSWGEIEACSLVRNIKRSYPDVDMPFFAHLSSVCLNQAPASLRQSARRRFSSAIFLLLSAATGIRISPRGLNPRRPPPRPGIGPARPQKRVDPRSCVPPSPNAFFRPTSAVARHLVPFCARNYHFPVGFLNSGDILPAGLLCRRGSRRRSGCTASRFTWPWPKYSPQ